MTINTTHGLVDEARLARTVGFEDRPNEFVVWVEWRLDQELVRRDAHVILKQPTVIADALIGQVTGGHGVAITGVSGDGAAGGFSG